MFKCKKKSFSIIETQGKGWRTAAQDCVVAYGEQCVRGDAVIKFFLFELGYQVSWECKLKKRLMGVWI